MLTQKYFSPDHLFSLAYPRVWDMEVYENVPAFFDPVSGNGALQVMAVDLHDLHGIKKESLLKTYPYLSGDKLVDKMAIFLHIQEIKADPGSLRTYARNGIDFIPFEYSLNGRFYMSVMMEKNNVVLLAVYNSATQPDDMEAGIIGDIIKSIELSSIEIPGKV